MVRKRVKASAVTTARATIESLTHDGHGVAHIDGKAVFVHGALPGEDVVIQYRVRRARYDQAQIVEILRPSAARVAQPRCPHFGVCGGCSLQHLDAAAQLAAKQQVLTDNLKRIGKVEVETMLPPQTGPVWNYRRKARLGVRVVPKKGGVLIGFREKRSSYITNLDMCATLDARVSALLPALRELIAALSCPDRIPQIEVAVGDDGVVLVLRNLVALTDADYVRLRAFAVAHGVQMALQPNDPASIAPVWPEGPVALDYSLPEYRLRFAFGPTDFVQVNAAMNRTMVAQALQLLDLTSQDRVLDLFCGLGNFTLPIARHAAYVLGVEANAALVRHAEANARANAIANAEFAQADLYDTNSATLATLWQRGHWDKLLLDPPRTGAIEVVKALPAGAQAPRRIVYVSCNPATLARDADVLVHVHGYRLTRVGVMDMFPQTTHVESIALFERD